MSGKLDRRTCGAYAIRPYSLPAGVVVPNDPQSVVVRVGAYGIRPLGRPLRGRMIKQWGTSTIIRKLGWHTCGTFSIPPPRLTSKQAHVFYSPSPSHSEKHRVFHSSSLSRSQTGRLCHSSSPSDSQTVRLCHSPTPSHLQTSHVFYSPSLSRSQTGRLCHSSGPSDSQTGHVCHSPGPSGSYFACKSASFAMKAYDVQRRCNSRALEAYYMRCE